MKEQNKKMVPKSFTMPKFLFDEFVNYCNKNNLNRSAVVRSLIEKYLKENK